MTSPSRSGGKGIFRLRSGRVLSRSLIRFLLVLFLLAVVAVEEYSILALRERMARQSERLKNISFELQTLKNERNALGEELSSMKKTAGDKNDGNTTAGKN